MPDNEAVPPVHKTVNGTLTRRKKRRQRVMAGLFIYLVVVGIFAGGFAAAFASLRLLIHGQLVSPFKAGNPAAIDYALLCAVTAFWVVLHRFNLWLTKVRRPRSLQPVKTLRVQVYGAFDRQQLVWPVFAVFNVVVAAGLYVLVLLLRWLRPHSSPESNWIWLAVLLILGRFGFMFALAGLVRLLHSASCRIAQTRGLPPPAEPRHYTVFDGTGTILIWRTSTCY
jgi:hypothetical protein